MLSVASTLLLIEKAYNRSPILVVYHDRAAKKKSTTSVNIKLQSSYLKSILVMQTKKIYVLCTYLYYSSSDMSTISVPDGGSMGNYGSSAACEGSASPLSKPEAKSSFISALRCQMKRQLASTYASSWMDSRMTDCAAISSACVTSYSTTRPPWRSPQSASLLAPPWASAPPPAPSLRRI